MQRALRSRRIQTKVEVGSPNDRYEREADAVADRILRSPDQGGVPSITPLGEGSVQRACAACAQEEEQGHVQAKRDGAGVTIARSADSAASAVRSGGTALPRSERSFFESRLGRDLSGVRIHTEARAAEAARGLGARAFTHGTHVAFAPGAYRPGTASGRRLMAHELTHVVQQSGPAAVSSAAPAVRERAPGPLISGDWIIDNPTRTVTAGGPTDGDHIEGGFQEICPLASRVSDHIVMGSGPASSSRAVGCGCLQTIEADLASASPVLPGTPHVRLEPGGWSFTDPTRPLVQARHPESEFSWGYWTGAQDRHVKPFWQTLAHEICGHVATCVVTGGAHCGGRRSGQGHNPAIVGENLVAAEHGVPVSEQRGLDVDPVTGTPLPGHRGESFLQANVVGYGHGAVAVPSSGAAVSAEVVQTIQTVASQSGLNLMVQVEGFAYANEGANVADRRAENMRLDIGAALSAAGVATGTISTPAGPANRFAPNIATIVAGTSAPQTSDPARRVQVYLFHRPHSAGP